MTSRSHGNEKEWWDGPTNTQDRQPDKVYNSQRNAQTHNKISFRCLRYALAAMMMMMMMMMMMIIMIVIIIMRPNLITD